MTEPTELKGQAAQGGAQAEADYDRVLRERNLYARTLTDANRLYEQKLRELSALQRVSNILRSIQSVKQVCSGIVDTMVEEVGAENCSLMLLDRVRGRLTIRAARGRQESSARYFDADTAPVSFPLGEGVAGWVAEHGEPVLIPDVGSDARFKPFEAPEPSVRSLLCLPLVESEQVWGVLNLSHPNINAFTEDNERILSIVAGQGAVALANVQLFSELQRMNEALEGTVTQRTSEVRQKAGQLAVINRIAKTVNTALDPEEALPQMARQIARLVSFDDFAIAVVGEGREELRVLTVGGEGDRTESRQMKPPAEGCVLARILAGGEAELFGEAEEGVRDVFSTKPACGMVAPLVFQGQTRGFILVGRREEGQFNDGELRLIEGLAEHVAVALEKSRLYKALVKMNEELESIVASRTRQLAESERHYRTLFEQSGDGIFLLDETGHVREANGRFQELVGCGVDGMRSVKLVRVGTGGEFLLGNLVDKVNAEQTQGSLKLVRPDGEVRYVELNLNPIMLQNRLHVLGVAHDTTRRRLLEEQLLRSEKLAAMGTLAASVAHEINNPLEGIKNCINVLRRRVEGRKDESEMIEQINTGFVRIRDIVRQILDFHRPGTEAQTRLDVNTAVNEVMRLFEVELRRRKVAVEMDLTPELPAVQGSVGRLQQVFTNIVVNAADAIEAPGKLTIKTRRVGPEVLISFSDTGCGIPREHLELIFEPFFTNKRSGQGTGLGLWISHSVVKEHGGRIEVQSEVGRGTTVSVFLPTADTVQGGVK